MKRKVISQRNLPLGAPVQATILLAMANEIWDIPPVLLGILGTIVFILWVSWLYWLTTVEMVDITKGLEEPERQLYYKS